MSCKCHNCKEDYMVDIIVPNKLWAIIRPDKTRPVEAGLLCGSCIMTEVERLGEYGSYILIAQNTSEIWPGGISDSLTLPCGICGDHPSFDYRVTDEIWIKVAPEKHRLGVICLPCFDQLATERGIDVSQNLIEVQYTGVGKTISLKPDMIYHYAEK